MGFKTMLVHVDTGRSASARLKFSADLAARFAAHVTGLYVRRPFQAPAFTDAGPAMDSLYRTYENAAKADEALATAAFRELVGGTSLSSEWRVTDGLAEEVVAGACPLRRSGDRRAGRTGCSATTTPEDLAETVAISASGRC
jgi:nucleotide-binding universal stress UspA family protein